MTSSSSSSSLPVVTPEVLWAQRNDKVFLTIQVHDVHQPKVVVESNHIGFEAQAGGTGAGMEQKWYKVDLNLFKPIDPEISTYTIAPRQVNFVLMKKEPETWPRCLETTHKPFWLKTDFSKYHDDDMDDDVLPSSNNMDFMNSFGNFDMSSLGGQGSFPGAASSEEDEDDEDDEDDNEDDSDDDNDVHEKEAVDEASTKTTEAVTKSSELESQEESLAVSS